MTRQRIHGRRFSDEQTLREETAARSAEINTSQRGVDCQMKIDDAANKLKSIYPRPLM